MSNLASVTDAAAFGTLALGLITDAAAVFNSTYGVLGDFGRYASPAPYPAIGTEADALAAANAGRAAVRTAVAAMDSAVFSASSVPAAVQGVVAAVGAAAASPADAMRGYVVLAGATGSSPVAVLARRLSVIGLALASSTYQPTSYDDATATCQTVTDALDVEIEAAGDAEDDASYYGLRVLRSAVVADLTARGASLSPLVTQVLRAVLPALTVAQLLYKSAPRADEIVRRVDPIHPLFMPTQVQVLAS